MHCQQRTRKIERMTELLQHFGQQILCGAERNTRVHLELFHKKMMFCTKVYFNTFFEEVPNETTCVVHSEKESAIKSANMWQGSLFQQNSFVAELIEMN